MLTFSYRIFLTSHTNRKATYMLTTAVLEHLRYGDDVRGAVEPSMSWIQATLTITSFSGMTCTVQSNYRCPGSKQQWQLLRVSSNVCSASFGLLLLSFFGITTIAKAFLLATLTATLLITVSACGLVRIKGLSYITVLRTRTSRHDGLPLPANFLYLGMSDVVVVQTYTPL